MLGHGNFFKVTQEFNTKVFICVQILKRRSESWLIIRVTQEYGTKVSIVLQIVKRSAEPELVL